MTPLDDRDEQMAAELENATPEEQAFSLLCQKHDLTHMYSDDSDVRLRGHREVKVIRDAAKQLLPNRAALIWNYWVQKKIGQDIPDHFLWTSSNAR